MKQIVSILLLCIFLSACQLAGSPTPAETASRSSATPTPQLESTPKKTVVPPTKPPSEVPSLQPTSTMAPATIVTPIETTPLPELDVPVPSFLYFLEGTLFEQVGNQPPQLVISLPQVSSILASAMLNDRIIVLSEAVLFKINLQDKTSSPILSLDVPARFGGFIIVGQNNNLIYQIVMDDLTSSSGFRTHLGIYDPMTGRGRPVADFPQVVEVLGLSADHEHLYLLPQGQDPSWGEVFAISIETGEEVQNIPTEGIGLVSPKGDFSVATGPFTGGVIAGTLVVTNLQAAHPQEIKLPNPPSHVENPTWSPDGRFLYFALVSEDFPSADLEIHPQTSYGLWRLDVISAELMQLAEGIVDSVPFVIVSSNGNWLLLRHQNSDLAIRVDLNTGESQEYPLPAEGVPDFSASWVQSLFSDDGGWALIRSYWNEEAVLIHLPTQTVITLALPSSAVVVGWSDP